MYHFIVKNKAEFQGGITLFFSIWTIGFLYAEAMQPLGFDKMHWFTCVCLLMISGAFLSAVVFKKPYVIGPGISIGWFATHQILSKGPIINFFVCIPLVGLTLIAISRLKVIQNAQHLLPAYLQETISVGIGLLFLKIALQNQMLNPIISLSSLLFLLSILLLLWFKYQQRPWGLLRTVLIVLCISMLFQKPQIDHLFSIPKAPNTIFNYHLSDLKLGILIKQLIALSLFSFFDTATGVFCLQEIQRILDLPIQKKELAKGYLAVGLNNFFSCLFLCGPNTLFIESAIGLQTGAKRALSLITLAFFFLIFMFCSALEDVIPSALFQGIFFFIGLSLLSPLYKMRNNSNQELLFTIGVIFIMVITQSILNGFIMGILINYTKYWIQKKPIGILMHIVAALGIISLLLI
jgi:AGZA family xanthine/uracil permease-like MFS transporter